MIISTLRGAARSFCQGNDLSPEYCYGSAVAKPGQPALSDEKRAGIILAVQSAFTKLKNLYRDIVPIFESYGFSAPLPGVIARDLSEKIEASIVQHCPSFSKGIGHCDLSRADDDWEVRICKDSGLTINQSKQIAGENYIVVNYRANSQVTRIFVLWDAKTGSSRLVNRRPSVRPSPVISDGDGSSDGAARSLVWI